ncbi:MAG: MFS transporter, partial [Propionibacteriaceae bacterium]|nr:MFS transporter [Propionibacteriaceae bacterium]
VAGVAGAGNIIGSNLVTALVFCLATVSGFVAPLMLPKIGHRGLSMWGFGLSFIGLMIGAISLAKIAPFEALNQTPPVAWGSLLVVGACILMWGHYWDASNGMTIVSMAAPARFKATASGFGYVFVKAASFFGAFVFPVLTQYAGKAWATAAVGILSLIGFFSAKYILPEMWGYVETEEVGGIAPQSEASAVV